MAGSVRVNLSVPERVDKTLAEYAALSGRTKAAVIMEAVGYLLPGWERDIRRERGLRYQEQEREERGAALQPASTLSPQAQWNLEAERKKAEKAKAGGG